jgi:hypothetical protein
VLLSSTWHPQSAAARAPESSTSHDRAFHAPAALPLTRELQRQCEIPRAYAAANAALRHCHIRLSARPVKNLCRMDGTVVLLSAMSPYYGRHFPHAMPQLVVGKATATRIYGPSSHVFVMLLVPEGSYSPGCTRSARHSWYVVICALKCPYALANGCHGQ